MVSAPHPGSSNPVLNLDCVMLLSCLLYSHVTSLHSGPLRCRMLTREWWVS